jgi:parallel beta-helix repeat protein
MLIEDKILYLDGWLDIFESGNLTIRNSTIVFNCTEDNPFGIFHDGSMLIIENCMIMSDYPTYGFFLYIYQPAIIKNSKFIKLSGDRYEGSNLTGIVIMSDDVTIIDCEVSYVKSSGILCIYSSPKIINTKITNCDYNGIEIYEASPTIENCTIEDCINNGIYAYSGEPKIINCTIQNNNEYGLYVEAGEPLLENPRFWNNNQGDVYREGE